MSDKNDVLVIKGALEVPGSYSYLKTVRHFISVLLTLNMIKTDEVDNIILVVDESVANIIRHSYKEDVSKYLKVYLEVYTKYIKIEIVDMGNSFDFDNYGNVDLQEFKKKRRKSGLGLYIIRNLIDKVKYEREKEGFNRLSLIKYL